ncbi:MAG: nucleotide pyrophosphohydrolase [Promethearchaeota archaeon]|nr:MAG: nucleotide pyrophosphohydrolase [Candidatus Lokiarchaeota archaeon]
MKISDFQNLMKELYYHQDSKRGIETTFIWLVEEMGELANNLKIRNKIDLNRVSEELADIIAWTSSIANLLEIDLEKALSDKYPNRCKKCHKNPCECGL